MSTKTERAKTQGTTTDEDDYIGTTTVGRGSGIGWLLVAGLVLAVLLLKLAMGWW